MCDLLDFKLILTLFSHIFRARGLAIGERLWSAKSVTDVNEAGMRMWEHRCRYLV